MRGISLLSTLVMLVLLTALSASPRAENIENTQLLVRLHYEAVTPPGWTVETVEVLPDRTETLLRLNRYAFDQFRKTSPDVYPYKYGLACPAPVRFKDRWHRFQAVFGRDVLLDIDCRTAWPLAYPEGGHPQVIQ